MTTKTRYANAERAQVLTATGSKAMNDVTIRVDVNARGDAHVQFGLYDAVVTVIHSPDERQALAKALWSTLS